MIGFFLLYALTAQRGLGWGDSGEFQYRVLHLSGDLLSGAESYATAHPLYIALARLVTQTPFQVTLLSSLFGALAVGGLYLCTQRLALAILFGFSHMLWWLSCVAEVQTMNLAFLAFEMYLILRFVSGGKVLSLVAASFLTGLHLSCHNFALLSAPAFLYLLGRVNWKARFAVVGAGVLGAAPWLAAIFMRGFQDVLVGRFGTQVGGILPTNGLVTAFNLALAAMSFCVPLALARWRKPTPRPQTVVWIFFATHTLFFVRYFVPDQATFLLPTLFFAYVLVAGVPLRANRLIALVLIQLLLPILAGEVLAQLPTPHGRTPHAYRSDATYFAYPWKFTDNSADRAAADLDKPWTGYP